MWDYALWGSKNRAHMYFPSHNQLGRGWFLTCISVLNMKVLLEMISLPPSSTPHTCKWPHNRRQFHQIPDAYLKPTTCDKDRNGMDLTEAEDIKKKWQEYTEERYKKDLHDQDNHDGVITHLEPDILECKVKWALESITTNKASGGDGTPVELFQILKDDAVKVLHSICQQIWKTQQWPQDWKRSVFIPILKKGNAKECSN